VEESQYRTLNYYRAIAIKTAWYWCKHRYEDQWNRIEDQNVNLHSYVRLIFDKGAKTYDGKKTASSANVAVEIDCLPAQN
jgi:hypothetical protein